MQFQPIKSIPMVMIPIIYVALTICPVDFHTETIRFALSSQYFSEMESFSPI